MWAAVALGTSAFAQGTAAVVLGQPLNFSVQLRTDTTEPVTPECIAAEVSVGDRKLPAGQVRTALETLGPEGARIRVTTAQRVDGPVVTVQLSVGCQARVTRRYMLMAEPSAAQSAAPAAPVVVAAAPPRPARAERQAPAGPRLRLDEAEPLLSAESAAVEQAIEVVAQAATAMRAAMAAASAADQRIRTLEQSVAQARGDASVQRDLVLKLQSEAAAAQTTGRWLWPMLLALLAMAALAGTLAWRLWRRPVLQAPVQAWREARASNYDDLGAQRATGRTPTSPTPFVASDLALPSSPAPLPAIASGALSATARRDAGDSLAPAADMTARRMVIPAAADGAGVPRDVSIEELIDLEQQAEFFVVLGQDSAAIDLLVEHLRLTGGGSPLPYLKLMEIYHRLGDQAAYARTRSRFNDRFNAYAPSWAEGPQKGRGLEDYPGVMPRLCQVWAQPLDAMAELEALLFRKSRGELFDLPAYREVLFLYALARDLFDRESTDTVNVDLLLPLHAQGDLHSTRPAPFDDSGHGSLHPDDEPGGRPTLPVDLDLSAPERSSSIFDPFDPNTRNSRR